MLFFSEYGQLMYSDGRNCIELFNRQLVSRPITVAGTKNGISTRAGEYPKTHTKAYLEGTSKLRDGSNGTFNEEEYDDEFAAIEVAGVDKNGNSKATHNVRPDKSKSSGRIFGMNGKQFVHSNDCDDEFADIEGNGCKSGRIRSSDRSCRGSVLRRGR